MGSHSKTVSLFVSCYFELLIIIIYDAHNMYNYHIATLVNVLIVIPVCFSQDLVKMIMYVNIHIYFYRIVIVILLLT